MILATPGPVEIPQFVREIFLQPAIHHRTSQFKQILIEGLERWKRLVNLPYGVFLSSSGTGAMEAVVLNLVKKGAVSVNGGKFGERWGKICKAYSIPVQEIFYPWDTPANVAEVVDRVIAGAKEGKVDTLLLQLCESSGGVRHPVEKIAKEVKRERPEIVVVVDGITGVGVEPIDSRFIDVIIAGSQKAFMLPPGLAMVGFSQLGMERIGKGKGFYFNLAVELKKQESGTTAFTPAVQHIIAFNEVVKRWEKMGLDNYYRFTRLRHQGLKEGIRAIGLELYPQEPALAMVAVKMEGAEQFRRLLEEQFQIKVAGGQDHLKDKIFRINNMGLIPPNRLVYILNSIELGLERVGVRSYTGDGIRAFSRYLFQNDNKK